jgi:DNA-binding transcriptional LysR family regulator
MEAAAVPRLICARAPSIAGVLVDTAELEIFRAVANERSVIRAARSLDRVPSNVTTRIQHLEEELGTPLFSRQNKRMELTPEGQRFLLYAERLLATAEEARQSLRQDVAQGLLRVGSMESAAASRLPKPLMAFHAENPLVKLEVTTGSTNELVNKVLERRLDCAIVAHPNEGPHSEISWEREYPELEGSYLFSEKLMLIAPPGFRRAHRKQAKTSVTTVAAFSKGCTYRNCAEEWITSQVGTAPSKAWSILDVSSYYAILACVAAGSAVGFLPQSVLDLSAERPPLEITFFRTVHSFLIRRKGFGTPAYNAFAEALRKSH